MSHAEQATELLTKLSQLRDLDPAVLATCAVAHAVMGLIEAVEGWQPPPEPEPEPDPQFTREGQEWP